MSERNGCEENKIKWGSPPTCREKPLARKMFR